jgi:hypothetical protein
MSDDKKLKLTGKETARITSMIQLGEKAYQPNQLVKNIPAKELEELVLLNRACINKADIEYCAKELKAEVIDHTAKPEKTAEKEAE